jgi:hypothetical protein
MNHPRRRCFVLLSRWTAMLLVAAAAGVLVGCGGGGSGDAVGSGGPPAVGGPITPAPPAPVASAPTLVSAPARPLVSLQGEPGDFVFGAGSASYDTRNASIRLQTRGSFLSIEIQGAQSWSGQFQLPGNLPRWQPGTYTNMARYPFNALGAGGLSWTGQGRGCNTVAGSVVVRSAEYEAGILKSIDMSFEQRCEAGTAALRGDIRVTAKDMRDIALAQNPLPANPVVALSSDVGDYIGAGGQYAYDHNTATLELGSNGSRLSLVVTGDEWWRAEFALPSSMPRWEPGVYEGLTRSLFNSPATGAVDWFGEGRGCNTIAGRMVVHSVRYEADRLVAIDMDFEQRCEAGGAALRGQVRWDAARIPAAPGPLLPMPSALWQPAADALQGTGNGMFIESVPGDFVGQGYTWRVYPVGAAPAPGSGSSASTASLSLSEANGLLQMSLQGAVSWSAQFKAMDGAGRLQPGYYGIVKRYPFHNPRRGGMSFAMDSRDCNTVSGWFAVDSVTYLNGQLASIDLRFAQFCGASSAPLRGRIRWSLSAASS